MILRSTAPVHRAPLMEYPDLAHRVPCRENQKNAGYEYVTVALQALTFAPSGPQDQAS
jgi:hypothetical protein